VACGREAFSAIDFFALSFCSSAVVFVGCLFVSHVGGDCLEGHVGDERNEVNGTLRLGTVLDARGIADMGGGDGGAE
jgi:hypothetical protein